MYSHHIARFRVVDPVPGAQDVFNEVDDAHGCSYLDCEMLDGCCEEMWVAGSLKKDRDHVTCLAGGLKEMGTCMLQTWIE
jgi:hypothetical protein